MLIDAHHHLWEYNERDYGWMSDPLSALRRNYVVADLLKVLEPAGVTGSVAVQARQSMEETEWLLSVAASCRAILGVVGWVPLCGAPQLHAILERLCRDPKFKGVRHVVQDEPDAFYILREDFNRGVALLKEFDLVYDVLIFERHLPQTIEFLDRHPHQVFVVDHIAKPRIKEGVLEPWSTHIRELARRPNVYCKISGIVTEADWRGWTVDQLRRYFDVVLEAFQPQRLMFGSDWPVLTLGATYSQWVDTFRSLIAGLSAAEQERISSGTAIEAYRLDVRGSAECAGHNGVGATR